MSQLQQNREAEPTLRDVLTAVKAIDTGLNAVNIKLENHIADSKQIHEDILSAVNTSFTTVTTEIHGIKEDVNGMKQDIVQIKAEMVTKQQLKEELGKINGEIGNINGEIGHIKTHMVTKEYLDDKLFDLKGGLVGLVRKEDDKVVTLVHELHDTKIISDHSVKRILALEPFPQPHN